MGHRDAVWTAPRCALLQLPSQHGADFLRHHVHGVGPRGKPGTARHRSASGAAPQRQVGGGSRGSEGGPSRWQQLCEITALQGCAVYWGAGELLLRGWQDAGHFWAPSPLCHGSKGALGPCTGASPSPQPLGLQPHLWVGNTSTISGVCQASVTGAVLVAAAGTRQHQGCWPTTGTW